MKNHAKKILRRILTTTIFICILFLVLSSQTAFAEEESSWDELLKISDIKQVELTESNKDEVVECKEKDISLKNDIQSFAVSKDRIVIIFSDIPGYSLGVFDKDMNLLKSFDLLVPEKICSVVAREDNIVVFPDFSGYATELTQDGEFVCLYSIPEDDDLKVYEFTSNAIKRQGGSIYYMSDNKEMPRQNEEVSYPSYLMKKDEDGKSTVLYDCLKYHNRRVAVIALIVFAFLTLAAVCQSIKYRKELRAWLKYDAPWKVRKRVIEARKNYQPGEYVYREDFQEQDKQRKKRRNRDREASKLLKGLPGERETCVSLEDAMEKYREFIAYWKVEFYKASKMKATYAAVIIFGSMSIFLSIVKSEGIVWMLLINVINICLIIKLKKLIHDKKREGLHSYYALKLTIVLLCILEAYYAIIIDYNQICLLKGLICINSMQMLLATIAAWLIVIIVTITITVRKIDKRWYKDKKLNIVKSIDGATIIGLGASAGGFAMIAKDSLFFSAAFVGIGILIAYTVKYYMCHYYVKKYDLADAINIIVGSHEDGSKDESQEEPKEKQEE